MDKPKRKYWMHRITGGDNARPVALPLLEKERYLSIGWSFLSNDAYAHDIQKRGLEAIEEAYAIEKASLHPNRYSLKRFVHDMQAGDYVVVPNPGEFSIYRIADNIILTNESNSKIPIEDIEGNEVTREGTVLLNANGEEIDLGYYRRVIPIIEHISRTEYAEEALLSRMKMRQTNADISDLWEEVENAIKAFETQNPVNKKDNVLQNFQVDLLQKLVNFCESLRRYSRAESPSLQQRLDLVNQVVAILGSDDDELNVLQSVGLSNLRFLDTSLQGAKVGYVFPSASSHYSLLEAVQARLAIKLVNEKGVSLSPLSSDKAMVKQSTSIDFTKWYLTNIVLTQGKKAYTRCEIVERYRFQLPQSEEDSKVTLCNLAHSGVTYYEEEIPFENDPIDVTFEQIIYEITESFRIEGILDISSVEELAQHIERVQSLFVKSLSIENYKLFSEFQKIQFKDRFTVIIGDNATGKTTTLSAIRHILNSMLPPSLNSTRGGTFYGCNDNITLQDINREILREGGIKYHFPLSIEVDFNEFGKITKVRKDEVSKTKNRNRKLEEYFHLIDNGMNDDLRLPLISYCGVDRTRSIESTQARNKLHNNRYDGYNSCLETHCSTAYLRMWLRELQNKAKQSVRAYELLESFVNAVCGCFKEEKIVNIEYAYWESQTSKTRKSKIDDIILTRKEDDGTQTRLLLRSMSAGYRSMIGLIADLAFRCICLNPQLGKDAIAGTYGVVLIDEIDMHLHPSWQRHIVRDLMSCFPKLQFIVTTHSPFIVQSLKKEQICNFSNKKVVSDPLNENLATNAYLMGIESDRSIQYKKQEDDAYDFLKALKDEHITSAEIDEKMKQYAILYSDNPAYVAKLRIEAGKAKNEILYKSLLEAK